jgi:hypothetical protein
LRAANTSEFTANTSEFPAYDLGYDDIIEVPVRDSYRNVIHKVLHFYGYVVDRYGGFSFAMKVDDDAYLDLPRIAHTLRTFASAGMHRRLYYGHFWGGRPIRSPRHKNCVAEETYVLDSFPIYAHGACYTLSADLVRYLTREHHHRHPHHSRHHHRNRHHDRGHCRQQSKGRDQHSLSLLELGLLGREIDTRGDGGGGADKAATGKFASAAAPSCRGAHEDTQIGLWLLGLGAVRRVHEHRFAHLGGCHEQTIACFDLPHSIPDSIPHSSSVEEDNSTAAPSSLAQSQAPRIWGSIKSSIDAGASMCTGDVRRQALFEYRQEYRLHMARTATEEEQHSRGSTSTGQHVGGVLQNNIGLQQLLLGEYAAAARSFRAAEALATIDGDASPKLNRLFAEQMQRELMRRKLEVHQMSVDAEIGLAGAEAAIANSVQSLVGKGLALAARQVSLPIGESHDGEGSAEGSAGGVESVDLALSRAAVRLRLMEALAAGGEVAPPA